jgi:homoserine O-acetyltransferase
MITLADMIAVQARLLDYLGVDRILAVAGGSMGGMQALQWVVSYPERVRSVIAMACTHRHSPQQIAFNEVARQAIMADPHWNGGDYYDGPGPRMGLAIARMVGHVTYLSDKGMERKFGRRLRDTGSFAFQLKPEFEVETYLSYQGESFVGRFDANSLLYLSKALDYFDLAAGLESLQQVFHGVKARFILIAFSSDWLYPPYQLVEVAQAVRRVGGDVSNCTIKCDYGHDSFLVEKSVAEQEKVVRPFLQQAQSMTS